MTHIVFASDNGFVRQLTVASSSAIYAMRNKSAAVSMHILDCGIAEEKWNDYSSLLTRLAQENKVELHLERHTIDMNRIQNLQGWTNGSKATWARILIPELLPQVDTCIYSDCDMLFIEDPSEMLKTLGDAHTLLVGHRNAFDNFCADAQWFKAHGLPFKAELYLCAGLIVMNLAAFRKENLVAKCFEFIAQYPNVATRDQATLNHVCYGRTKVFTDGWGLFTQECYSFNGEIKAIHFVAGMPWLKRITRFDAVWNLACLRISNLWYNFEERILKLPRSTAVKQPFHFRVLAVIEIWVYQITNILKIHMPARAWFQEMIAGYYNPTPALTNAFQKLFD
jgi:lipopolysaccharide biosynthesis glycosyltransferase